MSAASVASSASAGTFTTVDIGSRLGAAIDIEKAPVSAWQMKLCTSFRPQASSGGQPVGSTSLGSPPTLTAD
eukprot:41222-Eustigmatos_ZCMA.PRE.1